MSFVILFAILAFVFILLLLGGSVLVQSWIYNVPANRIVLRSVATGAAMAAFFTVWTFMDAKSPGKYDSIFEAADLKIKEYDKVVSVRKTKGKEEELPYKKQRGTRPQYVDEKTGTKEWSRSDADGMVVAIIVKEDEKDPPTRFDIRLDRDGKLPSETIFYEKGGNRYIDAPMLGKIVTPRSGSFMLRMLISVFHFALWIVALWFGLQYLFGHSLGFGFGFWVVMTFGVLPMLFNQMRPLPIPTTPPAKVQIVEVRWG